VFRNSFTEGNEEGFREQAKKTKSRECRSDLRTNSARRIRRKCLTGLCKIRISLLVKATLTELQREPGRVVRPVIHGGHKLTVTAHGQPCAEIVPLPRIDRDAALKLLREIGPVELPARE